MTTLKLKPPVRGLARFHEDPELLIEVVFVRKLDGDRAVMVTGEGKVSNVSTVLGAGETLLSMTWWKFGEEAFPTGIKKKQCLLASHSTQCEFTDRCVWALVQRYSIDTSLPEAEGASPPLRVVS